MIDQKKEFGSESREQTKIPSLKEVLDSDDLEIKEIFSGSMTDEKLKQLEAYLEGRNFSFKWEDWEWIVKIIQEHSDYEVKIKEGVLQPSEKMKNIYSEFPELLLALYLKNKTGVDYIKLREIFEREGITEKEQKEEIKKNYSIEKIENFIGVVENSFETFSEEKEKIKSVNKKIEIENKTFEEEVKKNDVSENEKKGIKEKIILNNRKKELDKNVIERINTIFTLGPYSLKYWMTEDIFQKELREYRKKKLDEYIGRELYWEEI